MRKEKEEPVCQIIFDRCHYYFLWFIIVLLLLSYGVSIYLYYDCNGGSKFESFIYEMSTDWLKYMRYINLYYFWYQIPSLLHWPALFAVFVTTILICFIKVKRNILNYIIALISLQYYYFIYFSVICEFINRISCICGFSVHGPTDPEWVQGAMQASGKSLIFGSLLNFCCMGIIKYKYNVKEKCNYLYYGSLILVGSLFPFGYAAIILLLR